VIVVPQTWIVALLLGVTSLQAAKIEADYDKTKRFYIFRTFTFVQPRDIKLKPPFDDSLTRKRMEAAIAHELEARGLHAAAPGERADLVVRYWTGTQEKKETVPAGPAPWGPYNPNWRWRGRAYGHTVLRYNEIHILVDLIERSTKELAWRASIRDETPKLGDMEKRIAQWMEKAFKKYPISGS
jgi:hypothetical protein